VNLREKVIVVIPHSHTWLWTQTCLAMLARNISYSNRFLGYDVQVIVVDNSPWSPAIKGVSDTELGNGVTILPNMKEMRGHSMALDYVVVCSEMEVANKVVNPIIGHFDYLMALETDVLMLRLDWLQWFMDQMKPTDYAVGAWHHEQFVNPSCTLYRGDAVRAMAAWCRQIPERTRLRWGPDFSQSDPLDRNVPDNMTEQVDRMVSWVCGPFAEKRGWPPGTKLKETPSGQMKGPGHYEPGQQFHHQAVEMGYTYTVCPTITSRQPDPWGPLPLQTLYGSNFTEDPNRQLWPKELVGSGAYAAHMWGGTRALDIIKHTVADPYIQKYTSYWLTREARYWKELVPPHIQSQTLELIRQYGFHYRGQGTPTVTDRDKDAVEYVRSCYRVAGVEW
jgi:hypothetical protein